LLNLIAALDWPTSGELRIAGRDIAKLSEKELALFRRHHIGLIFQAFNLLPTLDALQNVLLPAQLERKPTAGDRARAQELLGSVGLSARLHARIHELSGGEMQRVAIARSLMLDPELILADEPTGNLDSRTGVAILDLLKRACRERGATIVMVTHDKNAARIGDRIVILKDGEVAREERVASARTPLEAAQGARS
jgi:putative ABC transport system ATP-binding protein